MAEQCEISANDLNFCGNDPGAVKHGNFINYYSFHDVATRIKNLQLSMFPQPVNNQLVCLDVGCNTGELTNTVYDFLKKIYPTCVIHMLAIDIDSVLIKRAKELNTNPHITFSVANIMDPNDYYLIQNYLNAYNMKRFDISFCFSVTMWIHLNNGDEGLLDFLKYIKSISRTIVIEPQPWKCYKKAQRRLKRSGKSFELFESLKITNNVDVKIKTLLSEGSHKIIYESPSSAWGRKVLSFQSITESVDMLQNNIPT